MRASTELKAECNYRVCRVESVCRCWHSQAAMLFSWVASGTDEQRMLWAQCQTVFGVLHMPYRWHGAICYA